LTPRWLSLKRPLARLALALIVALSMSTVAGGLVSISDPTAEAAWLKLLHVFLAGIAGVAVLWMARIAWREYRDQPVLLPLTTVMTVLFFGQAAVGTVIVERHFPMHLVVLHALSALGLWVSLVAVAFVAFQLPDEASGIHNGAARQRIGDFFALAKPWIVVLLLLTTYAGLVAGHRAWPAPALTFFTLLGGALAAAGSSALNQYIERDLDRQMQRTSRRPLAERRLTSSEGVSFGLALCLVSYYVMAIYVNFLSALLCLAGIVYYVLFYTLWLKKATVQNIVIGGGAGAIPPMVGWAAATGQLSLAAWILFAIVFMWTPPHFWALAIVRKQDYERAGVPMLPVVRGELETRRQILLYTVELVAVTFLLPILHLAGLVYSISAFVLGGSLIYAAWRVWKVGGNKVAWTMYRWSSLYLAGLFLAVMLDAVG